MTRAFSFSVAPWSALDVVCGPYHSRVGWECMVDVLSGWAVSECFPKCWSLLSNPLIPDASVRMSHMIETAISAFLFGVIIVWLLHRKRNSVWDLFKR